MTTGHVYIACSFDGYIAAADGGLDWLMADPPSDLMARYDRFMADKDGIVMGRATFQTVLAFPDWPFDRPVAVLSSTLAADDLPRALAGKVTLLSGDPPEVMARLHQMGWRKAYIDGGATVSAFLRAGQVADLIVTRLPVILGAGIPLFTDLPRIDLHHVVTETLDNGATMSRYLTAAGRPSQP